MAYIGAGLTRFNTADELTVTGDAQFDTNTLVIDSTNDRVGIGTSSPDSGYKLDVHGNVVFGDGGGFDMNVNGTRWQFSVGGTERMRLDNNGRLGIGTTSPTQEIHGYSSGGDFSLRLESASATGTAYTYYKNADQEYAVGIRGSASDKFQIIDYTADTTRLAIDTSGNVGIGTSSPSYLLDVSGHARINATSNPVLRFAETGTLRGLITSSSSIGLSLEGQGTLPIKFNTNGAERMRISGSGEYVGIGTSSPSGDGATLHLDGSNANSTLHLTNSTTGGGAGDGTYVTTSANNFLLRNRENGYVSIYSNNTERMRITADGSTGIGTTSPNEKLHVNGAIRASSNAVNWSASDGAVIDYYSGDARIVAARSGSNSSNMQFYTFSSGATGERMRVTSAGNVGIGTTSPAEKLQVNGIIKSGDENATGGQVALTGRYDDTHLPWTIGSSYSSAAPQIMYGLKPKTGVGAEDKYVSSASNAAWTRGVLQVKDTLTFSNAGSQSTAIGTEISVTERMRITASGLVGINKSSPGAFLDIDNSGATTQTLIVLKDSGGTGTHSQIQFNNTNGLVGQITTSGSSTSYATSSDHRLKENAVDMTGSITRVKSLQPKRFNFIADTTDTLVDGFMAHEAQTVVPEAVSGTHNEVDDDGNAVYQGIDQSKLVPLLTGALQEAIAKIETLETEMTALKARVTTLENA